MAGDFCPWWPDICATNFWQLLNLGYALVIIWSYHSNMVRHGGGDSDWDNNCVSVCPWRQNKIWITLEVWNSVWNSVSRCLALTFSQNVHFEITTWGNFPLIGELTNQLSCTTWNEGNTSILKYQCCRPHFKAQIWHAVGSVLAFICLCKVIKIDNATYHY